MTEQHWAIRMFIKAAVKTGDILAVCRETGRAERWCDQAMEAEEQASAE